MPQSVSIYQIITTRKLTQDDALRWYRKHWALGVMCPEVEFSDALDGRMWGKFESNIVFISRPGGGLGENTDSQAESFAKHVGGRVDL